MEGGSSWTAGRVVTVDGADIGYVRAGRGRTTVVLLHGWPQSSHAWRHVFPLLTESFDVIAFDLPGVGLSSPRFTGFDKRSLADTVWAALERLEVDRIVLVGHDFGAMVAYACARRHADEVSSLVLLDQAIPGLPGWDTTASAYPFWHLGFHRDVQDGVGVAETLVSGNEAFYFRNHFSRFAAHPEAITAKDLDAYLSAYTPKSRMEAGFGMFRALAIDAGHNERDTGALRVPVFLAFGEYSQASYLDTVAEGLRDVGVATVTTTSVRDCGHWMAEEQPAAVGALLLEAASA